MPTRKSAADKQQPASPSPMQYYNCLHAWLPGSLDCLLRRLSVLFYVSFPVLFAEKHGKGEIERKEEIEKTEANNKFLSAILWRTMFASILERRTENLPAWERNYKAIEETTRCAFPIMTWSFKRVKYF